MEAMQGNKKKKPVLTTLQGTNKLVLLLPQWAR